MHAETSFKRFQDICLDLEIKELDELGREA